ncbi:Aste57867_19258 [Aphanomyces stellatus]|uniref:Aste57867_19258 protein n=1 Tax=Aphanomyces stellatus TaxID=120398 RepID=A0A485LC38_9STRA|nr:hypothetical protein As57867_019194 [Aphanomyces stellatus]VFT95978.1 Aste57867_19258 [Aphanomyces stellatus]
MMALVVAQDDDDGGGDAPTRLPATLLDLTKWSLDTPEADSDGHARRVYHPELDTYANDYLSVVDESVVQLLVPANGATTSGSHYPRTEFREVLPNGQGGRDLFNWDLSRHHVLNATLAIAQLPPGKPGTAVGQLFGSGPCVIVDVRARRGKLELAVTNHFKPWATKDIAILDTDVQLGQQFSYVIEMDRGTLSISYNGKHVVDRIPFAEGRQCQCKSQGKAQCYFKAGNYLQTNTDTDDADAVGRVYIYSLATSHT